MFKKTKKRAFTMVELVIVIAVIAILAAVLIPTFAHLIKAANESADQQAVKNMNTALIAEENINGIPKSPEAAMKVIEAEGYNVENYVAQLDENTLYYDWTENRVLIWTVEDGVGSVTYPSEMAKAYSGAQGIAANWYTLSNAYITTPASSANDVTSTLSGTGSGDAVILQLQEDVTDTVQWLNNGSYTFTFNSKTVSSSAVSGTAVTIDLNGYAMNLENLYVINGGSLYIKNGTLDTGTATTGVTCLYGVAEGSSITLENVNITSAGSVVLPCGDAAQVNIINSTIKTTGAYCVSTNASSADNFNVLIHIEGSTLECARSSGDSCAVVINVPSTLKISDSTIIGQRQGVIVRAGEATITNTSISCTVSEIIESSDGTYFGTRTIYTRSWGSGNEVAMAAVEVGNSGSGNYLADAKLEMSGCTLTYEAPGEDYDISLYMIANSSYDYSTTVNATNCTFNDKVICLDISSTSGTNNNRTCTYNLGGYTGTVYTKYSSGWTI